MLIRYLMVAMVVSTTRVTSNSHSSRSTDGTTARHHRYDLLTPYKNNFGAKLNHRQIRECEAVKHGGVVNHVQDVNHGRVEDGHASVSVRSFTRSLDDGAGGCVISGHVAFVEDPLNTLSVLEAVDGEGNGCRTNTRSTVAHSSWSTTDGRHCAVAVNAGFFDTPTGGCKGNVVSNGIKVQDSGGIQNAHFGIMKSNKIFTGYLAEDSLENGTGGFEQLVGGVIWLIKDGKIFVNQSQLLECEDSQESGTLKRFTDVKSARTAVGHDRNGRVIIAHVNGQTDRYGINLWELSKLMLEQGAVNAINLDGGGSSTFVVNGTVVNQVSDDCAGDSSYKCERKVTTILCATLPHTDQVHQDVKSIEPVAAISNSHENKELISWTFVLVVSLVILSMFSVFMNAVLCFSMRRISRNHGPTNGSYVARYSALEDVALTTASDEEK